MGYDEILRIEPYYDDSNFVVGMILFIIYYMCDIGLTSREKIMSVVFGICIPYLSSIVGTYTLLVFVFVGYMCSKYIRGWRKILFVLLGVALGLLVNHNFISQQEYIRDMSETLRENPPDDGMVSIVLLFGGSYWRPLLGYYMAIAVLLALCIGFGIGNV